MISVYIPAMVSMANAMRNILLMNLRTTDMKSHLHQDDFCLINFNNLHRLETQRDANCLQ